MNELDNGELFLIENNYFTYEELDNIREYGNFYCKKTENGIVFNINLNNYVPFYVISMIHKNVKKSDELLLSVTYHATNNASVLNKYIISWLESNNIKLKDNADVNNIIFKLEDDNLSFNCDDDNYQPIIKYKDKIIEFLNNYGIYINNIICKKIDLDAMVNDYLKKINNDREQVIEKKWQTSEMQNYHETKKMVCKIFQVIERRSEKQPYGWYVWDGAEAHIIKMFAKNESTQALPESLKVDDWIEVTADFKWDEWEKSVAGTVKNIKKTTTPEKWKISDKSTKPRIELFAHTKMSTQDGISSAEDIIRRAEKYKVEAVGIADRSNVQSFPQIDYFAKHDIKPLYGIEINVWDRHIPIVVNSKPDCLISKQQYVVFDIETTGLNNEHCEMIEFGAIKVENGIVIEKIDLLIKTNNPLPKHITSLTNITDEMLSKGVNLKDALTQIVAFVKGCVLIAHNGINFDLPFLNKVLLKNNFKIIDNTLIDTMQLSRAVNVKMKRHNLGVICREYKITYDDDIAHRADYDASVLFGVWNKMVEILSASNILAIADINNLTTSEHYYHRQFSSYMQIYAKNQEGLKALYKLITTAHIKQSYGEPTLFRDQIEQVRENLIITSSPFWGDLWEKSNNGTDEELRSALLFYDYVFVAPVSSVNHLIASNRSTTAEVVHAILRIISMARKCQKPVAAVSACYYLDKNEQIVHDVFIHAKRIEKGIHPFYVRNVDAPPLLHYRTTEEMLEEFSFVGSSELINEIVIKNTYKFADMCERIEINKKELYTPEIENVDAMLQDVVSKKLFEIYGHNIAKEIVERKDIELQMILSKRYSVIYWISYLLVRQSNKDGFLVGSRGSVGSSFIAFLMDISEVNPLPAHYICDHCHYHEFYETSDGDGFDLPNKTCPLCGKKMRGDGHDIPFDTFLGTPGAEKVPDVDLNFSSEYQPLAQKFIVDKFGKEKAFKASTVLSVAEKTAYGFIKDYYEQIQKELPNKAQMEWMRSKCVGAKRASGQHPGGMVIVPDKFDVTDFFPYQLVPEKKTGENNSDWFCTHFPFEYIHDSLLKFDILGHDFPTRYRMMQLSSKVEFDKNNFNDKKVVSLFTSLGALNIDEKNFAIEKIGTYGLPECFTDITLQMIKEIKPKTFADLVRFSGLSHGTEVWHKNAQDILSNNKNIKLNEVVCYREDMQRFFASKGIEKSIAFKVSESVRKGKGVPVEFTHVLIEKGVPPWYINSCDKIKYLFPKAHATAYIIGAFICGWYKIYYPIHFYAAYFNTKIENFYYAVIIQGIDKLNETIKELSKFVKKGEVGITEKEKQRLKIYKIALEFYCRNLKFGKIDIHKSGATQFVIDGDQLIPPFNVIEGCGDEAAASVVKARKEKQFQSIQDIVERTKLNKTIIQKMRDYGILDEFNETNQMSIFDF